MNGSLYDFDATTGALKSVIPVGTQFQALTAGGHGSGAVSAWGMEGSGTFNVNLLQNAFDVDDGAVLHVANLVRTDGGGMPAGFALSPDGNSISVDTNSAVYNSLAQGETFIAHFGYDVVDEHGASVHQTAAVTIAGTNDAPVIAIATLAISQGGTAVLDASKIVVTDPDSTSFTFTVSNVSHGTFQTTSNGTIWVVATTFTTADLNAGRVRFVHDGGGDAPTFAIRANDGVIAGSAVAGSINFSAYPQFALTVNSDSFTGDPAGLTVITGNAATLTSGDSLMGAGHDVLTLSGGGNFDLNAIAAYSGIAQVNLTNATGTTAFLSLRNGAVTDVVIASGSGPSTLNVGGNSVVNSIQGHWGNVDLAGNVTIGSIHGDGDNNTIFFADAVAWNPTITIDGAGGSDTLFFWGFVFAENDVTIDLRAAHLTSIENLVFPGVNNTLVVDSDALAGFTTLTGFGSRILTYDATLDLTGKTVGELSVQSANADGTTFTVSDKATALHVYGGNGQDTLQASSFAFTPRERDIIFATSSIETIIDSSGMFTASPDPHVFKFDSRHRHPGVDGGGRDHQRQPGHVECRRQPGWWRRYRYACPVWCGRF